MNFNIRNKEFEVCNELKKYYVVRNIDDWKIGDLVLGYGIIKENDILLNPNTKEYYLVSKKSLQVFASYRGCCICSNGYVGKLKYGKAKWVKAHLIKNECER